MKKETFYHFAPIGNLHSILEFKEFIDVFVKNLRIADIKIPDEEQLAFLALKILDVFAKKFEMQGWQIMYDNMGLSFLANCYHKLKIITLNHNLIGYVETDEWVETILHELAHAKTGQRHTKQWRDFYIHIGGKGFRFAKRSSLLTSIYKYKLVCPECGTETFMHRRGKDRSCGNCSEGKYNPKYKMEWTINVDYNKKISV